MKKYLAAITLVLMAGSLCSAKQIPEGKGPSERDEKMRERMLKQFDKDGDGKLSESEKATMKKIMKERKERADLNGDGTVSEAERKAAREEMLKRLDTDGDGKVSKVERDSAHPRQNGIRPGTE